MKLFFIASQALNFGGKFIEDRNTHIVDSLLVCSHPLLLLRAARLFLWDVYTLITEIRVPSLPVSPGASKLLLQSVIPKNTGVGISRFTVVHMEKYM